MAEYRVLVEKLTQGWVYVEAADAQEAYATVRDYDWDDIECIADWGTCGDERNVYNDVEFVRSTGNEDLWK